MMLLLKDGMCPGLDEDVLRNLRAAGVRTVEDLVSSDIEELAQKSSVSYKALFAVRRVLMAQHTAFPVSGADLYEELLDVTAILSTGNPRLDGLLDPGLYTGELTELVGGPGCGKSQVCFGVVVHISHYLKHGVVYIDTTGGLTSSQLLQMLKAKTSITEEQIQALQRIHVFRVFDIFSLLDTLYSLRCGRLHQTSGRGSIKAVIVDSISAVVTPLLGGRQNEGLSLMTQIAGVLKTMAKDFNLAALVTNHLTRKGKRDIQPGLGLSWSHAPRTRILLERMEPDGASHGSPCSATLIKSSRQPCQIKEEFDLQWWASPKTVTLGKRKCEHTSMS